MPEPLTPASIVFSKLSFAFGVVSVIIWMDAIWPRYLPNAATSWYAPLGLMAILLGFVGILRERSYAHAKQYAVWGIVLGVGSILVVLWTLLSLISSLH